MSVISRLACMQGRRDEEPNKILARELVENQDTEGIKEIAENLWSEDKKIQGDCLSVLEEVGRLNPDLIGSYVPDFLRLLSNKNNRLVWGAMITLGLAADRKPEQIYKERDTVIKAIEGGSVITRDNGIKTLAVVASMSDEYNRVLFPYLVEHLKSCRPKSVPQHAESVLLAVTEENQGQYIDALNERYDILSSTQQKRIRKILNSLEGG